MKKYIPLFKEHLTGIPGGVKFDSGAIYTRRELEILKGADPDILKSVHLSKEIFKSEVILYETED